MQITFYAKKKKKKDRNLQSNTTHNSLLHVPPSYSTHLISKLTYAWEV